MSNLEKDIFFDMNDLMENVGKILRKIPDIITSNSCINYTSRIIKRSSGGERIPDIQETEKEIIATYEIPGTKKEDIEVNVTPNQIEVSAKRQREKDYSKFCCSSYLPSKVICEGIKANYQDGILKVIMQKAEKTAKVKVDIE